MALWQKFFTLIFAVLLQLNRQCVQVWPLMVRACLDRLVIGRETTSSSSSSFSSSYSSWCVVIVRRCGPAHPQSLYKDGRQRVSFGCIVFQSRTPRNTGVCSSGPLILVLGYIFLAVSFVLVALTLYVFRLRHTVLNCVFYEIKIVQFVAF